MNVVFHLNDVKQRYGFEKHFCVYIKQAGLFKINFVEGDKLLM